MADSSLAPAYPAATVVLLRDYGGQLEVLLVRRNANLSFHGGHWVFPGGRVDKEDHTESGDVVAAARRAAVREAREEAGIDIDAGDLALVSRWVTPEVLPKRFDTWFFVAPARDHGVRVDGGEIHDFRWMTPAAALAAQRAGEIELPPPTHVTLLGLGEFGSVASALAALQAREEENFLPRLCPVPGGACTVYQGDAAYDTGDIDRPGRRHRLYMVERDWRYERS